MDFQAITKLLQMLTGSKISDSLSESQLSQYKNLKEVSSENFYFALVAKLIRFLKKSDKSALSADMELNVLGNKVNFSVDSENNSKISINGTPIDTVKFNRSVSWLEEVVKSAIQLETEGSVSINRPNGRSLSDDREDFRLHVKGGAPTKPIKPDEKKLKGEELEKEKANYQEALKDYDVRKAKYDEQVEHDSHLKNTFFNKLYEGVVGSSPSALKKNASQQPFYDETQFVNAKKVNPSFNEKNYSLKEVNGHKVYLLKSIDVIDLLNATKDVKMFNRNVKLPVTEKSLKDINSWKQINGDPLKDVRSLQKKAFVLVKEDKKLGSDEPQEDLLLFINPKSKTLIQTLI